ncbi:MAG: DUF4173 domain-containing protein [Hominenteromicrobium sp.]
MTNPEKNVQNVQPAVQQNQTLPQQPAPVCVPPAYAVKPKRQYTVAQKLLAIAVLFFGYFYMRMFFFTWANIGRTLFVWLLLAVSAVYLAHEKIRPNAAAVSAGALTAAFSLMFTVGLTGLPAFLNTVFCQLGYTYFVYKSFDTSIERGPGELFGFDLLKAVFVQPFSSFGALFPAMFARGKAGDKRVLKTVGLILLGLLVSVVPTAVVVSLLSFDRNFSALFDRFFRLDLDAGEAASHIAALILGIPVAMYIFGLWASGSFGANSGMNRAGCTAFRTRAHVLPQLLIFAAATPVLAVYILFFASQFAYYTAAFTGVLPAGYSYAEYARSGFFELCAVMAVNACMALLIQLFVKRSGRNIPARVYTALIGAATLILAATAFSKMLLYVDAYGLTVSRVYTLWFMLAMALVFVILLVKTAVPKTPFVPIALSVLLVLFGGLIFSNVPAAVSAYNTEKVLAGEAWELDCMYFEQLGEAAVPDAVRLEKSEAANAATRAGAAQFLDSYAVYGSDEYEGILDFSIMHTRAQQALAGRQHDQNAQAVLAQAAE